MAAWDQGCKGCTTYRPNDVTGSVLSVSEEKSEAPVQVSTDGEKAEVVYLAEPLDRPQELDGATYKLKWPDSEHAIYITVNDLIVSGHRRAWMQGKYVPSILAAIGGVIEKHMIATGFLAGEGLGLKSDPQADVVPLNNAPKGKTCTSCGGYELRMVEGCMTCGSCGYSKCG